MRRKYNLKKLTSTLKNEYELKQDGAQLGQAQLKLEPGTGTEFYLIQNMLH